MQSTNDIRRAFLDYFAGNEHYIAPSAPLVPYNDPTLMFVAAGMVPFKNVFTGLESPPAPRAASSQKCVRAGGKHNDLDNVGYTARHLTFFEMLGNFSFGDYFKERAIELAWNLVTRELGLDSDRLLVTVYHTDDQAHDLWRKIAGLPDERIIRIATKDNFWAAGPDGPCGPCSEIFYDYGPSVAGGPPGSPDEDGDRFVEIWNLVFMQHVQANDVIVGDLPRPSIDTGMGLERIASVMQGQHNVFETDTFRALIEASESLLGAAADAETLPSHRVIADHLRSTSFLMADGVLPSNEGRGYVLRRIMRRAMRHAHLLGAEDPLMHRLVPALVTEMGAHYPELGRARALIQEMLEREETRFRQTLDKGLRLLDEETAGLAEGGELPGETAFKLYDTYGFPYDLTEDALRERGIGVDKAGFDEAMARQKSAARAAWKGSGAAADDEIWFDIVEREGSSEFTGYTSTEGQGRVVALVVDGKEVGLAQPGQDVVVLTNQTPFYGESGGQSGDAGRITGASDLSITVTDTSKPLGRLHAMHGRVDSGTIAVGDTVNLAVDGARRDRIRANHSATHLLHAALAQRARRARDAEGLARRGGPPAVRFLASQGADRRGNRRGRGRSECGDPPQRNGGHPADEPRRGDRGRGDGLVRREVRRGSARIVDGAQRLERHRKELFGRTVRRHPRTRHRRHRAVSHHLGKRRFLGRAAHRGADRRGGAAVGRRPRRCAESSRRNAQDCARRGRDARRGAHRRAPQARARTGRGEESARARGRRQVRTVRPTRKSPE